MYFGRSNKPSTTQIEEDPLILRILVDLVFAGSFDPSDYSAFQAVFGMIFTMIIALEFKKSLLVVAERRDSVIQVRTVVVIALLAICRKVIILDLAEADALHVLALAAAILALGTVYWLIHDRDLRDDGVGTLARERHRDDLQGER